MPGYWQEEGGDKPRPHLHWLVPKLVAKVALGKHGGAFWHGGAPMEDQQVLRIELALEVSMPQTENLFQALSLAFWRFQGVAATELFAATLKSIEDRLWMNLMARGTRAGTDTRGVSPGPGNCPLAR